MIYFEKFAILKYDAILILILNAIGNHCKNIIRLENRCPGASRECREREVTVSDRSWILANDCL